MRKFDFSNYSVLVVGDVILDEYLFGSVKRISPEAPVPIFDYISESNMLGGAANIAANISSLGAKSYLCGVAGYKDYQTLKPLFSSNSIDFCSSYKDHTKTIRKTRLVSNNQQLTRIDRENNCYYKLFSKELIEEIKQVIYSVSVDLIIISDYNKGTITQETLDFISQVAKNKNIPIFFGPKPSNVLTYSDFRLLSLNRYEAEQLSKTQSKDLTVICKSIYDQYYPSQICITLGSDGIFFFDAKSRSYQHFLTTNKSFLDVCGAGDTVLSTISLFLHAGFSIEKSCFAANSAASIVIQRQGTSTIGQKELENLLN